MNTIAILILAAGNSSRMKNTVKQLLPWQQTTLLGYVVNEAKKVNAQSIYVVLGANAERIKMSISDENIIFIENKHWEKGMGSTIAFGIDYILKEDKFDAVLIQLADQPFLEANYLNKMLRIYLEDATKIVATKYPTTNGVPAIFNRANFIALTNLTGDKGAKELLKSKDVITIDPKEKAVDIDTWEEYERLINKFNYIKIDHSKITL